MPRITETIGFSVPPPIARQFERLAKTERRTKSELFREMVRVYEHYSKKRERFDEAWALRLMQESQKEERLRPMTPEEEEREEAELNRYAEAQTKKAGIKEKDIPQLIEASRARRRKHAGSARQ